VLTDVEPSGLLALHGAIKAQMSALHGAAAATRGAADDVHVLLKFESSAQRFEDALDASFGYVVQAPAGVVGVAPPSKAVSSLGLPTPSSTPQPPSPTHSSPLEGALAITKKTDQS